MMQKRINSPTWAALLWVVLVVGCGNAWAASAICQKPDAARNGSGIGGTGMVAKGSGVGGTGMLAKGTGVGGTGLRPDDGKKLLQLAGSVIDSKGTVEARLNGKSRRLAKNDPVCTGETIVTSNSGSLRIKMADGGLIEVRPHTRIRIETFDYGQSKRQRSLIALSEGASRFVTGKIGKEYPQNVIVKTPSAIIGVHGTDHEITIIPPGGRGSDPAGTYDKVNVGVTFIRTAGGEIDIHPDQVGFAASDGEVPVLLDEIPGFLHADLSVTQSNSVSEVEKPEAGIGETAQPDLSSHDVDGGYEQPELLNNEPSTIGSHEIVDLPHLPDLIEPPELPEPPESPEIPELPELPEMPDE